MSYLLRIVRNEPTTGSTKFSAYRKPPCVPGFLSLLELRCHAASCPRRTSELGWPSWSTFMGSLFVQLFVHTLLKSCSVALAVSTWHLRTEKLKWNTVPSSCAFYARSETLWNKPDIALVHSTSYYWPLRGCRSLGPPSGLPALGRTSWPATTQRPISNLSHAHTGDILYPKSWVFLA